MRQRASLCTYIPDGFKQGRMCYKRDVLSLLGYFKAKEWNLQQEPNHIAHTPLELKACIKKPI